MPPRSGHRLRELPDNPFPVSTRPSCSLDLSLNKSKVPVLPNAPLPTGSTSCTTFPLYEPNGGVNSCPRIHLSHLIPPPSTIFHLINELRSTSSSLVLSNAQFSLQTVPPIAILTVGRLASSLISRPPPTAPPRLHSSSIRHVCGVLLPGRWLKFKTSTTPSSNPFRTCQYHP